MSVVETVTLAIMLGVAGAALLTLLVVAVVIGIDALVRARPERRDPVADLIAVSYDLELLASEVGQQIAEERARRRTVVDSTTAKSPTAARS